MKSIKFAFAIILLLLTASLFTACIHTHSYGEWYTTKSATCTEDGEIVRFCDCGKYQAYVVGNLGHNYVNKICERCWMSLNYSYGLEYTSNGDGTCYVSGIGTCTDTDIVIPTVLPNGEAVAGIGERAFRNCSALTSVVIPDSVTGIGVAAFEWCSSLTSVVIPDSVTSIGDWAFSYCDSLVNIEIPNSVTSIDSEAFSHCNSLTSVVIGGSVTSIGDEAFDWCDSLEDVYYTGSEADWEKITIGSSNDYLTNATIHYNYAP